MLSPRTSGLLRTRPPWQPNKYTSLARSVSYSSKVRALPFAISPHEAQQRASFAAALLSWDTVLFRNVLRALKTALFPSSSAPFPAKRVQAAYLPGWFVDAEVGAKAWLGKRGDDDAAAKTLRMHLYRSYMPGVSYDPLSRLSFSNVASEESLESAVPFSPELARQHDQDVTCIPYTVSPFAMADAARSLSLKQAVIAEDFRFDPTTVKDEIIAAYPLLVPVYLLQYETASFEEEVKPVPYTIIVEASTSEGQMILENPLPSLAKAAGGLVGASFIPPQWLSSDFITMFPLSTSGHEPFTQISYLGVSGPEKVVRERAVELSKWADEKAVQPGAMKKYERLEKDKRGEKAVDFEDPRVRPYNAEDTKAAQMYMLAARALYSHIDMIETLKNIESMAEGGNAKVITFGQKRQENQSSKASGVAQLEEILGGLEKQKEKLVDAKEKHRPAWLKGWDELQKAQENNNEH